MFDLLNLVFLGTVMLSDIVLYIEADYKFPDKGEVVAISTFREWWRDDSKCKYTGIMTPYVRDWPEVIKNGDTETVLPPEPDRIIGQAVIINKKVCGDTVEPIFRTATIFRGVSPNTLYKHGMIKGADFMSAKPDYRPKWMPQILKNLEKIGEANPAVKIFLAESTQYLEDAQKQAEKNAEKAKSKGALDEKK